MYRQGDVLLLQSDTEPTGYPLPKEGDRVVLVHGQATGHHHAIAGEAVLYPLEGTQDRLLVLPAGGTLTHEEHTHIQLPAGGYTVRRQREYSPQEIRNVAD